MKIDLPSLSLALQRASLGVKRTKDPSSGAALLSASNGLLRVSRTDGQVLSDAECPCEGDIHVAVDADRLKELLRSSAGIEAILEAPGSFLEYLCGGVRARLDGYKVEDLPRHTRPEMLFRAVLSDDLGKKLAWAQKLTQEAWDHNQKPIEHVVAVEWWKEGQYRGYARLGSTAAVRFEGQTSESEYLAVCVNKSLIERISSGVESLRFSGSWIGFECAESATFEPRVECPLGPDSPIWKLFDKCPEEGAAVDPKVLSTAISGAAAVQPKEDAHLRVTLTSKDGLTVSAHSWAGEYSATVPFEGPEWSGTFNASLLTKIITSLKAPQIVVKDSTLWAWDGPYKVALQGIRL